MNVDSRIDGQTGPSHVDDECLDGDVEPVGVDPDFKRLIGFTEPLISEYRDIYLPEWDSSPIGWIRQVPSVTKRGKIGEEIVRAWAASEGILVDSRGTRGHDCVLAGMRVEVKTSLRWNSDRFVFLGLRDFDYDAVALLGLEPNGFRLWIAPKRIVWERAKDQLLGASGRGSKWVSFIVGRPPQWLSGWGGSFAEARTALFDVAKAGLEREIKIAECDVWRELSTDVEWSWLADGTSC
jgi:hypothetical protein